MENCCKRFPHVGKMILNNLDDQSLVRSKEASRGTNNLLKNERFYFIRTIGRYNRRFEGYKESWNEVIKKTPINILEEIAYAVEKNFKIFPFDKNIAPLQIIVQLGKLAYHTTNLKLCQYIVQNTTNKNPMRKNGIFNHTVLHEAAMNGDLELCKLIVKKLKIKNPANKRGQTPHTVRKRPKTFKNSSWLLLALVGSFSSSWLPFSSSWLPFSSRWLFYSSWLL